MRHLPLLTLTSSVLLVGCSSEPATMPPDIMGQRLDVALSDVERAGFGDDVEVLGGGTFGVVDESNWYVCSQEPSGGTTITDAPRVTVDRSCEAGDSLDASLPADDSLSRGSRRREGRTVEPRPDRDQPRPLRRRAAVGDTFVMPALVGLNLQRAQNQLQSLGSFLLTQTDGTGEGRFQMLDYGWKVCAQNPSPGVQTDILTMVELVTVKLDEAC